MLHIFYTFFSDRDFPSFLGNVGFILFQDHYFAKLCEVFFVLFPHFFFHFCFHFCFHNRDINVDVLKSENTPRKMVNMKRQTVRDARPPKCKHLYLENKMRTF